MHQSNVETVAEYGRTVLHGPFRGMKYPMGSLLSRHAIPILFGTYELELHPIIEEVASRNYDRIVDIGCAEGYYAVGLALQTDASVYAFDCEPRERFYCRQTARENRAADRIHVRSWCSARTLQNLAVGCCLIIADCEGYEVDLFSDDVVTALRNCDLIVEPYEHTGMGVRSTLFERFIPSHGGEVISFDARDVDLGVPDSRRKFAGEFRSPGQDCA